MSNVTWTDVGLVILAILLPPLAVFIKAEEFNKGNTLAIERLNLQPCAQMQHNFACNFQK